MRKLKRKLFDDDIRDRFLHRRYVPEKIVLLSFFYYCFYNNKYINTNIHENHNIC